MSLINQMLQDLDTRRAGGVDKTGLPSEVRPLPVEQRTPWLRIAVGAIVAGLLAGGAIIWSRVQEQTKPLPAAAALQAPAQQAQNAPVPPAPEVKQPVAAETALPPAQQMPQPVVATPAVETPVAQAQAATPAMQGSRVVATPALPPAEPKKKLTQSRQEQVKSSQEARLKVATSLSLPRETADREPAAAATARPSAPAAIPLARTGEGPPSIEKQARVQTPHDRAENEYRKAAGLLNQGRLNEAIAGFRAALQEEPAHANARLTLFGVLVEQKKLDEAQALLQEGLSLNPAQPQLALRLARIQVERGDLRGAAETLQKSSPAASANAEYRGFHAAVLQRLNRHKEAAEEYRAALRLAPQAGVWWMGLGISLETDGRSTEARDAFQRAKASGALSAELERFVEQKLRASAPN
jgi:MSHA biogenesis protein MshN